MSEKDELRKIPFFREFSDEELTKLTGILKERVIPRRQTIFLERDPGDSLYIVREGCVRVYCLTPEGQERTIATFGRGEFFGEMAILDGQPRSATAETMENTRLFVIHAGDFVPLVSRNGSMAWKIIRALCVKLRETTKDVMEISYRGVRERLAQALLKLADKFGVPDPLGTKIDVKITHMELAKMISSNRETVTRMLQDLSESGLVEIVRRKIIIRDPGKLREECSRYAGS
jgi:CRP/FNR family transcriptional regulator